ncbi:polysaccharide deacetylase family protein [Virgibacillus dakarensis]|uniref:Polysaccharide deacetylase YheN n=1 Tax=Lentibacillus populi TaxID=1827502 RepID=A0A9W5X6L3_9BACI|nr:MULTISPECIES: polysaccharide deacetylase family protein [Bacillaceae]MBT2216525.1 polysaccharide deacetylase family protein [Virgibacillus dakarensis]MTW87607.1 polysaccharide deacetylase family protein [Virgibacillus dakarensis]GGB52064.1 putative polysaccharide deacetylase YheN [Lentibacillus populi]
MKKLKLFIFLACLVIFYGCQSDLDHDQKESKAKKSIVTSQHTESELNNKKSMKQKTESEKSEADKENIEKTVYLTFDDGPTSATTDILDTLHQFDAEATFFMLEPSMKELPEAVDKIVEEGHAAGLHGVTHDIYHFYKSEQSALEEMTTAQETLKQIADVQSNLIRTPYGSVPYLTESYREVLDSNGFKVWDWNIDSDDWSLSGDQYVDTVIGQIEELVNAGEAPIILMHDKQNTADHLSKLLTYLAEHGFQTKKIEENTQPYNFNCYQRCHRLSTKE